MIKTKKIFLSMLMLLFLVSSASAAESFIKIKTMPDHEVQATAFEPDSASFLVFESFKGTSDEFGDVNFTFSSAKSKFNLAVYIKKDNEKILSEMYRENYATGENIYIELAPAWFSLIQTPESGNDVANITNSSLNIANIQNISINSTNNSSGENNQSSSNINIKEIKDKLLANNILYYVLGLILLAAIVFLIIKNKEAIIKKISSLKSSEDKDKIIKKNQKIIISAKSQIQQAREEIKKLEDEDKDKKIKEIKEKMVEYEKELIRLRQKT